MKRIYIDIQHDFDLACLFFKELNDLGVEYTTNLTVIQVSSFSSGEAIDNLVERWEAETGIVSYDGSQV